jgi:hypothetical protein
MTGRYTVSDSLLPLWIKAFRKNQGAKVCKKYVCYLLISQKTVLYYFCVFLRDPTMPKIFLCIMDIFIP